MTVSAVILAAGKGTRMVSDLPKAIHPVCGLPLTEHCVRAMKGCGVERPVIVIGHQADRVREALGPENDYALQEQQLGTGHAAMQALPALRSQGAVQALLMPGDAPLITSEALADLRAAHLREGAHVTLAVCEFDDPAGYGRILRDDAGRPVAIVEERDCTPEQRAIKEVCTSFYCFEVETLGELLPRLSDDNAQGEFYLTDIIAHAARAGKKVATWTTPDPSILIGVNDRWQLAMAEKALRTRKLRDLARSGVTIADPDACYVDMDVEIGPDTVVHPGCCLHGATRIGVRCVIGPNSRIVDSEIADDVSVLSSNLVGARVGGGTRVGPFANVRPGTVIGENCVVGDFVELKNCVIGDGVSLAHLTYAGDADIGGGTNVGAGTITCNYDGKKKSRTIIGKHVFIGSNNTLVAPVEIGEGAFTAAGSTITDDVPPGALGIGRAKQENKEGWVEKWRKRP